MSTVSICIPCLNGEATLPQTLKSVSEQMLAPQEIILCDNGSRDGSLEIMQRYAKANAGVRVVSHPEPTGMTSDWNRTIQEASSDWVILLPCDDLLPVHALALHESLRAPGVIMTAGAKGLLTSSGRRIPGRISRLSTGRQDGPTLRCALLRSAANLLGEPGAVAFKKTAFDQIGGFDPQFRYYPDVDLWIRLLAEGDCLVTREVVSLFRIHGRSLTGTNRKIAYDEWKSLYRRHFASLGLPESPTVEDELRAKKTGFLRNIVFNLLARL